MKEPILNYNTTSTPAVVVFDMKPKNQVCVNWIWWAWLVTHTLHLLKSVSANLKVVHIGPKHVHIGHVLVQATPKIG